MKAIATFALLGLAYTFQDNELIIRPYHPPLRKRQPIKVEQSLPTIQTDDDEFFGIQDYNDNELIIRPRYIPSKKNRPDLEKVPVLHQKETIHAEDEFFDIQDFLENELTRLSKLKKKKNPDFDRPQHGTYAHGDRDSISEAIRILKKKKEQQKEKERETKKEEEKNDTFFIINFKGKA